MSAPDDPSDSANRAQPPAKLGLGNALPELGPPEWMSANIRRQAHEQAELSRQRGVRAAETVNASSGPAKAPSNSRRAWLPLAGSLASLGVVLLLVTGQPFKQPVPVPDPAPASPAASGAAPIATDSAAAVLTTPEPGSAPRAEEFKRETTSPSRPTANTTRPAVAPAKPAIKPQSEASANSSKSMTDRALVETPAQDAASTSVTAPPAPAPAPPMPPPPAATRQPLPVEQAARAPAPVQSDTAAARAKLPDASPASPASSAQTMRRALPARTENEAYSGMGGRLSDKSAQIAAPSEPVPDSVADCIQTLEALVKAQRLDEARRLFSACSARFENTEWPVQLRQQLGLSPSN